MSNYIRHYLKAFFCNKAGVVFHVIDYRDLNQNWTPGVEPSARPVWVERQREAVGHAPEAVWLNTGSRCCRILGNYQALSEETKALSSSWLEFALLPHPHKSALSPTNSDLLSLFNVSRMHLN